MRDIKFRGKNGKEWICGSLYQIDYYGTDEKHCYILEDFSGCEFKYSETEEKTVGQYTGKKDKNGKEIYEGDIVRYTRANYDFIGKIIYSEYSCSFVVECLPNINEQIGNGRSLIHWNEINVPYIEIMGNIYETPHLLTERATDGEQ